MSEISEKYEPSDHPSINDGSASQVSNKVSKKPAGLKEIGELSKYSENEDLHDKEEEKEEVKVEVIAEDQK